MKKTILLFVFNGFADWQISYAMAGIVKSGAYNIKTISLERDPVTTMSGMCVFPDLDFRPEVDLHDIEHENTAMIILPGGSAREGSDYRGITSLIKHCIDNHIPVAASGNCIEYFAFIPPSHDFCHIDSHGEYTDARMFANTIFEVLNIGNGKAMNERCPSDDAVSARKSKLNSIAASMCH